MNADKLTKYGWLTASAVGVLLAAQGGVAAEGDYQKQQQTQAEQTGAQQMDSKKGAPEFSKIDQDNDGQVQWQDIESELDQELQQANLDRQQVMDQFDQNNDQALDQQEYDSFQTALNAQIGAGGQQQTAQANIPEFDQIDQDNDGQAQWQDIQSELDQELQQANMDRQQVMDQYDQNNDQALDQQEYQSFQTALSQQVGGQQTAQANIPEFDQIDQDNDGQAQWQDIQSELDQELQQANMDRQQVMDQYDQNNDQALDQQEYQSFQTALNEQISGQQMAGAGGQAQQEQEFETGQQQAQQDQQQQQQAQAGQAAQDVDTTLLTMPVDQVTQADVVNSRGEEIGSVSRVVRDQSTGELALIVESGGILGLGASSVLVNLDEVSQMGENQLLWDTMLSQDEIGDLPGYDETQYTEISENEYATLGEARRG